MIKVNLLATAKREPAKKAPAGGGVTAEGLGAFQNIAIVLLIAATGLVIFLWYRSLSNQSVELDQKLVDAQEQMKKVEEDRRVADELEKKRQKVEHQINLITQLKNEQQTPVRLLDEISRNLPDFLWLTSLNEAAGQLTFSGRATTPTAYANFYNNLDASPYFTDVGRISYRDEGALGVAFSLSAKFVAHPDKKAKTPEATEAEGAQ